MKLQQIDVVAGETAQRGVDGAHQMHAAVPDVVRSATAAVAGLGCDQDVVASRAQRLAEHRLAFSLGVDVGGVEQVDARVERDAHDAIRFFLGEPAYHLVERVPGAAEGARPERDARDEQADPAELLVLHQETPRVAAQPAPV